MKKLLWSLALLSSLAIGAEKSSKIEEIMTIKSSDFVEAPIAKNVAGAANNQQSTTVGTLVRGGHVQGGRVGVINCRYETPFECFSTKLIQTVSYEKAVIMETGETSFIIYRLQYNDNPQGEVDTVSIHFMTLP